MRACERAGVAGAHALRVRMLPTAAPPVPAVACAPAGKGLLVSEHGPGIFLQGISCFDTQVRKRPLGSYAKLRLKLKELPGRQGPALAPGSDHYPHLGHTALTLDILPSPWTQGKQLSEARMHPDTVEHAFTCVLPGSLSVCTRRAGP